MNRILIIDDEDSIRHVLRLNLEAKAYAVAEAAGAHDGIQQLESFKPNLIILDLGLPDRNGFAVLKEIREWSTVPVIILTVDDDEQTKVALLEAGADDYITKPFGSLELLARVQVALRHRGEQSNQPPVFTSGDLKVDVGARRILKNEVPVHLTLTETNLLKVLLRAVGQVVHQDQILTQVWGPNAVQNPHYLRIYIGQLRKKLETNPSVPVHILTEPGVGYRIV